MTAKKLIDDMIEGYAESTGCDIDDSTLEKLIPYITDSILSRKMAAKIIHIFIRDILKMPDLDWLAALKLQDIYECRTCANSIAQVFQRGIIEPLDKNRFGLSEDFPEEAEKRAIAAIFQKS